MILRCAVPNSALYAADELTQSLRTHGIEVEQEAKVGSSEGEKSHSTRYLSFSSIVKMT